VPGLILAAVSPDNTPHGYNWTFAFPGLLFIVIAGVLYLLFSRPHRRVPNRPITAAGSSQALSPSAARAASVAGGFSEAPGGGSTESQSEPTGAHLVASSEGGTGTSAGGEGGSGASGGSAESGGSGASAGGEGDASQATGDTTGDNTEAGG
jgi:hypothetical protein